MFKMFYPDEYVVSTYVIHFEKMYEQGYRGLIFDIDNTLVPHGAPADSRSRKLFERLREIGFDTCLISNNQEPRVKPFAEEVKANMYLMRISRAERITEKPWSLWEQH